MYASSIMLALCAIGGSGPDRGPVELKADTWFNPPSIRVPEDRTYVLFFFTTFQDRQTKPFIARLNKLHHRRDTIVIGLTPESKERVKPFIKKAKIRFTVGAHSLVYKHFHVKRFPRVVVLQSGACVQPTQWTADNAESLDAWFPDVPDDEPLESRPFDDQSTIEQLQREARTNPDYSEQKRAVRLLRDKMPAEEFMRFCDEMLETEYRPALRGAIAYQKQLADPNIPVKEPETAPSWYANQEFRKDPKNPMWQPVHDYYAQFEGRTMDQLFEDYMAHMTDDPVDLVIRGGIPDRLGQLGESLDKKKAREYLMQVFSTETDFVIRQHIAGAFLDVCEPGDFKCADFLEGQLKTEKNVRLVRPMLEYTIRYVRTGEE